MKSFEPNGLTNDSFGIKEDTFVSSKPISLQAAACWHLFDTPLLLKLLEKLHNLFSFIQIKQNSYFRSDLYFSWSWKMWVLDIRW